MSKEIFQRTNQPISVDLLRDRRGRIRWGDLKHDTECLERTIELEAKQIVSSGSELKYKSLTCLGRSDLLRAIQQYYPGGLFGIRATLNVETGRVSKNHWKNPEEIRREVQRFVSQGNKLSHSNLHLARLSGLASAIWKYYPGGMKGLRIDLGIEVPINAPKKDGYWTPEEIEKEARDFFEKYGEISREALVKFGRNDLRHAIYRKYPGKMKAIIGMFGLKSKKQPRNANYWTQDRIEKESMAFYEHEGRLSYTALIRSKRYDLLMAIQRRYPGGIFVLRERFGIADSKIQYSISPENATLDLWKLLEVEHE